MIWDCGGLLFESRYHFHSNPNFEKILRIQTTGTQTVDHLLFDFKCLVLARCYNGNLGLILLMFDSDVPLNDCLWSCLRRVVKREHIPQRVISKWFMLGENFQVFCSSCLPFHLYSMSTHMEGGYSKSVFEIWGAKNHGGSMNSFRRPTHFVGVDLCEVRHHQFLYIKSFWNKKAHSLTAIEVMVRHYYNSGLCTWNVEHALQLP